MLKRFILSALGAAAISAGFLFGGGKRYDHKRAWRAKRRVRRAAARRQQFPQPNPLPCGERYIRLIDSKYAVNQDGEIFRITTGEVIPRAEPVILFRARDTYLPRILDVYWQLCSEGKCGQDHLSLLIRKIQAVRKWQNFNESGIHKPGEIR